MTKSLPLLVLNIGSSSIKYALFDMGNLDKIDGGKINCLPDESEKEITSLIERIPRPGFLAHRIVHGGDEFKHVTLLNDDVLTELEKFIPFAPLHQPYNLNGVRVMAKLLPDIPQYACFDTEFHTGRNELYSTFAIPLELRKKGLKRYGFHGLSYEWISGQFDSKRLIIAHLGSGCSLCALLDGKSVDTTMGLTALDGLPMSTRSGNIDPGLVLYLLEHLKYTPDQVEHILYRESGMKGLSGISGDFKTLQESDDDRAKFALDYFILKTAQEIGRMAVSIGGIDTLVFTGGVGENSEEIRNAILDRLSFFPPFETIISPTNEEKMIALLVKAGIDHA